MGLEQFDVLPGSAVGVLDDGHPLFHTVTQRLTADAVGGHGQVEPGTFLYHRADLLGGEEGGHEAQVDIKHAGRCKYLQQTDALGHIGPGSAAELLHTAVRHPDVTAPVGTFHTHPGGQDIRTDHVARLDLLFQLQVQVVLLAHAAHGGNA